MSVSVARFTRFDLTTIATTQPVRLGLPLLLTVLFSATLPVPGAGVVVGALIAAVTVSVPFQGDEHGRLDVLYGVAPVGRSAVVLGRYASLLVIAAVAIAIGAASSVVLAAVRHETLEAPAVATLLLVAVGIVSAAIAVQVPWFFALGFHRGRPMIYVPVAVVTILGFFAGRFGLFDATTGIGSGAPAAALGVAVVAGCVLLLAVSSVVAIRCYRRREL
ncbi:ABC-2 transporter permease [Amnibacterium sp.]|uniref:ABC-2 transporter permease n=1 Tax=Amnibacterium sp. TaxID=1872496 RepID=UPI003F7CA246